jgi:transcriptional regulator with XRE-family HTH domain
MKRHDLLKSPEYWIANIQISLYNCAERFMKLTGKNRAKLAEHLGVSRGYVSQLLNGDYDHKLSKLVELSLSFGFVPKIEFIPLEEYLEKDELTRNGKELYNSNYKNVMNITPIYFSVNDEYKQSLLVDSNNAA